jgi:sRNA-binding regulator protein Hfq
MANRDLLHISSTTVRESQAGYLAALEGKQVTVVMTDGKAMKGELTGVDTYEVFLRQSNGLEVMIKKGAILHPAAVG